MSDVPQREMTRQELLDRALQAERERDAALEDAKATWREHEAEFRYGQTMKAERDAAVAQRDALRDAIGTDDDVEAYLRALQWTPDSTDHDRTLVAGNIRTFHAWIQDRAGIGGGS